VRRIRVRVPATIGNVGPGFDALGLALDIHNEVVLSADDPQPVAGRALADALAKIALHVDVEGEAADQIERDRRNLIFRAACEVFSAVGCAPARMSLALRNAIPFERGLGSSAAATVAGVAAANALCGRPLDTRALLDIASRIEGHPDNAAPALMGGLTVCMKIDTGARALRFDVPDAYRIVLCIPEVRISTAAARNVMPESVSLDDAVFSMSRAAALVGLLTRGETDGLREALDDRLHQPYRLPLVKGLAEALQAALSAGALGAIVSGSGPTLAAFVPAGGKTNTSAVGDAMAEALKAAGTQSAARLTSPSAAGVVVL